MNAEQVLTLYQGSSAKMATNDENLQSPEYPLGDAEGWTTSTIVVLDESFIDNEEVPVVRTDLPNNEYLEITVSEGTASDGKADVKYYHSDAPTVPLATKTIYYEGKGSSQVLNLPLNDGKYDTGYYKDKVRDISGESNHGIINGNKQWTSQGLYFDDSGDYIDCGTGVGSEINGSVGVTFAGWFKLDTVTNDDGLFTIRSSGDGDWYWNIRPGGTNFRIGYKTSGGTSYRDISNPFSGENDKWVHLATTYSDGHLRTYKNGVEIDDYTGATGTVSITANAVTQIGSYDDPSSSYKIEGHVDAFNIHKRVLTAEEINTLDANFLESPAPESNNGSITFDVTIGQDGHVTFNTSPSVPVLGEDYSASTELGWSDTRLKQLTIKGKDVFDAGAASFDPAYHGCQGMTGIEMDNTNTNADKASLAVDVADNLVLSGEFDTIGTSNKMVVDLQLPTSQSPASGDMLFIDLLVDTDEPFEIKVTGDSSSLTKAFNVDPSGYYLPETYYSSWETWTGSPFYDNTPNYSDWGGQPYKANVDDTLGATFNTQWSVNNYRESFWSLTGFKPQDVPTDAEHIKFQFLIKGFVQNKSSDPEVFGTDLVVRASDTGNGSSWTSLGSQFIPDGSVSTKYFGWFGDYTRSQVEAKAGGPASMFDELALSLDAYGDFSSNTYDNLVITFIQSRYQWTDPDADYVLSPAYPGQKWLTLSFPADTLGISDSLELEIKNVSSSNDVPANLKIGRIWLGDHLEGGLLPDGVTPSITSGSYDNDYRAFSTPGGGIGVHVNADENGPTQEVQVDVDLDYEITPYTRVAFDYCLEEFGIRDTNNDEVIAGIELLIGLPSNPLIQVAHDITPSAGSDGFRLDDSDYNKLVDHPGEWRHADLSIYEVTYGDVSSGTVTGYQVRLNPNGNCQEYQFKVNDFMLYEQEPVTSLLHGMGRLRSEQTSGFYITNWLASPMYPAGPDNNRLAMHNLVANSGFENDSYDVVNNLSDVDNGLGWRRVNGGTGTSSISFTRRDAFTGQKSLSVSSIDDVRSADIYLTNDGTVMKTCFKFSYWARGIGSGTSVTARLVEDGSTNHDLASGTLTEEWTYHEQEFDIDASYLQVKFVNTVGTVLVDDVRVEPVGTDDNGEDPASEAWYRLRSFDPDMVAGSLSHLGFASLDGWYEICDESSPAGVVYVEPLRGDDLTSGAIDELAEKIFTQYYYTQVMVDQPEPIDTHWSDTNDWQVEVTVKASNNQSVYGLWVNGKQYPSQRISDSHVWDVTMTRGLNNIMVKQVHFDDDDIEDTTSFAVKLNRTGSGWTDHSARVLAPKQARTRMIAVYHDPQYQSKWLTRSSDAEYNNVQKSDGSSYKKTSKMILDLPLNEGEGTKVLDQSFNGNDGTLTNFSGTYWKPEGLNFDGTNDRINVPETLELEITSEITISAWIYPEGYDYWDTILAKSYSGDGYRMAFYSDDVLKADFKIGSTRYTPQTSSGTVPQSKWSHVTITYDGSYLRLYVNGKEESSQAATGSIATNNWDVTVGDWGYTSSERCFNGKIREAKIWNYALSDEEINQEMASEHYDPVEDNVKLMASSLTTTLAMSGFPAVVANSQRLRQYMETEIGMYAQDSTPKEVNYHPYGQVLMSTDVLPDVVWRLNGNQSNIDSNGEVAELYMEQGGKIVWTGGYVPFSIAISKGEAVDSDSTNYADNGGWYDGRRGHQYIIDSNLGTSLDSGMFLYDDNTLNKYQNTSARVENFTSSGSWTSGVPTDNPTDDDADGPNNDYKYGQIHLSGTPQRWFIESDVGKPVVNLSTMKRGIILKVEDRDDPVDGIYERAYTSADMGWSIGDQFIIGEYFTNNIDHEPAATFRPTSGWLQYNPFVGADAVFSKIKWNGLKTHGVVAANTYKTEVIDEGGQLKWRMKEPVSTTNQGVVDPARDNLWFKPYLESDKRIVVGDTTITGTGNYQNTVINTGIASVQAGTDATGMFSYLPMFNWNEGKPGTGNDYSLIPLSGISFTRDSQESNVLSKYSDRKTGGLLEAPVTRLTARKVLTGVLAQQAIDMMMNNLDTNMCRDNDTTETSFLGKAISGEYETTNVYEYGTAAPHISVGGTLGNFGVDKYDTGPSEPWTQNPLFKGSHLKFQWYNGDWLRNQGQEMNGYPYPKRNVSNGDALYIEDLAGSNDGLNTWIGMDSSHTLDTVQFAYVKGLNYSGSSGADLYTSMVPMKNNQQFIEEYSAYKHGATAGTAYTFGTEWLEHRDNNYLEWDNYAGKEYDESWSDSRGMQYAKFLDDSVQSGWRNDIDVDSELSRELIVRNPLIAKTSRKMYKEYSYSATDETPWIPRGVETDDATYSYNRGFAIAMKDGYKVSHHQHYLMDDDIEDYGWSWSATGPSAVLKWPYSSTTSEWADVSWDASKIIDHKDMTNVGLKKCFGVKYEELGGSAPPKISGGAYENSNEDAVPTMWLAPGLGESNSVVLEKSSAIDVKALSITPPSGKTNFKNTPINYDLCVDPVKRYGVKMFDDSGSVSGDLDSGDQNLYTGFVDLPNWSVHDAFMYFDETVEGVRYIKIWVAEVYDEDFSEFTDKGSGDGDDNQGGISEVRVFDQFPQPSLTILTEEAIRPPDNDNVLFYDLGAGVLEQDHDESESSSNSQMIVTVGTLEKDNDNPSKKHDLSVQNVVVATSSVTTGQQVLNIREAKNNLKKMMLIVDVLDIAATVLFIVSLGVFSIAEWTIKAGLRTIATQALKQAMTQGVKAVLKAFVKQAFLTSVKASLRTFIGSGIVLLGTAIMMYEIAQSYELFGPIGPILFGASYLIGGILKIPRVNRAYTMQKRLQNLGVTTTLVRRVEIGQKVLGVSQKLGKAARLYMWTAPFAAKIDIQIPTFWSIVHEPLGHGDSMDDWFYGMIDNMLPDSPFARILMKAMWDNDVILARAVTVPVVHVQYSLLGQQVQINDYLLGDYKDDYYRLIQQSY
jgi:hypothetical protein